MSGDGQPRPPVPPPPRASEAGAEAAADHDDAGETRFDRRMLEFLVCPVTLGPLIWDSRRRELVSKGAGLAFPVVNGVPVMLIDEARKLDG